MMAAPIRSPARASWREPLSRLTRGVRTGIVAALLASSPAFAQGIYLDWGDCPSGSGAAADFSGACVNTNQENLLLSFELAEPIDGVIALDATVDVISSAPSMPAWWQYAPDGCRYEKLLASAVFPGLTACADFWAGQASLDAPPNYAVGIPPGGASQSRIDWSIVVPSTSPRALVAATRYYAARLVFQNDPNASCGGCDVSACLVLQKIRLWRIQGDVLESRDLLPAVGTANRVTWQGPGANCDAVPARRSTWGQLKALYR